MALRSRRYRSSLAHRLAQLKRGRWHPVTEWPNQAAAVRATALQVPRTRPWRPESDITIAAASLQHKLCRASRSLTQSEIDRLAADPS
jgi:hypothetical protein